MNIAAFLQPAARCPDCASEFARKEETRTADPTPISSIGVICICPNGHVWEWTRRKLPNRPPAKEWPVAEL